MKNEKGFAITTLVYGLSILGFLVVLILMETISTSRANNRELAKAVERELNKNSVTDVAFNGSKATDGDYLEEIYVIPHGQGGWFRIELWGSSGTNGKGAYTSGFIRLEEGDTLHFYIGKKGKGKETDVRLISGGYDERSSYESRIMAAAGGGNVAGANGGTLEGYQNITPIEIPKTVRGIKGVNGGDGFFPSNNPSYGGTSFISGYGGAISIYKGNPINNNPTYEHCPVKYNEETDTYYYDTNCSLGQTDPTIGRKYYFRDGIMLPSVNDGDGKARIERISPRDTIDIINKNMLDVKEIIDCVDGTNNSTSKISAMINGIEIGITKTPTVVEDPEHKSGTKCKHITFSSTSLDEIASFHTFGENPDNHRIIVRKSDNSILILKKAVSESNKKSELSSPTGYRISAYQHDSTTNLPPMGTYYISPVSTINQVLTSGNPVVANLLSGTLTQKWQIEKNSDGTTYKILESSNNKSITESGSKAISTSGYNGSNSSKWSIIPLGNGLYRIKNNSTNHYMAYNASTNQIVCNTSTGTETLFKFYKLDLS